MGDEALSDDEPFPGSTVKTSGGRAGLQRQLSEAHRVSGVSSAGLSTTVLPAASAGANPQPAIGIGKFHGTMTPTTPSGSWKVTSSRPAPGSAGRQPLRRGRVVVEDVADVAGLPAGVADGVPGVAHLQLRQLLEWRRHGREPAQQPARSPGATAATREGRRARSIAASVSSATVDGTSRRPPR
jgi:hypothetical protein